MVQSTARHTNQTCRINCTFALTFWQKPHEYGGSGITASLAKVFAGRPRWKHPDWSVNLPRKIANNDPPSALQRVRVSATTSSVDPRDATGQKFSHTVCYVLSLPPGQRSSSRRWDREISLLCWNRRNRQRTGGTGAAPGRSRGLTFTESTTL